MSVSGVRAVRIIDRVMACPRCGGRLVRDVGGARCDECGEAYPARGDQLDLRLRAEKTVALPFRVRPLPAIAARRRRPVAIPLHPDGPDVDPAAYPGDLMSGNGLTRELVSWLPRAVSGDEVLLDMGCGDRRCEPVLRSTGMHYVGMDIDGSHPDLLGIGEALPFRDHSFDVVFTLSVVPHTTEPALVMRELYRVLKPGGRFVGTAEFLEPCHMQSRHHVTALGLQDWLDAAGFDLVQLEANGEWLGLHALLQMGLAPRLSWKAGGRIARALAPLHRLQARESYARPETNTRYPVGEGYPERITGGFRFVADRPV